VGGSPELQCEATQAQAPPGSTVNPAKPSPHRSAAAQSLYLLPPAEADPAVEAEAAAVAAGVHFTRREPGAAPPRVPPRVARAGHIHSPKAAPARQSECPRGRRAGSHWRAGLLLLCLPACLLRRPMLSFPTTPPRPPSRAGSMLARRGTSTGEDAAFRPARTLEAAAARHHAEGPPHAVQPLGGAEAARLSVGAGRARPPLQLKRVPLATAPAPQPGNDERAGSDEEGATGAPGGLLGNTAAARLASWDDDDDSGGDEDYRPTPRAAPATRRGRRGRLATGGARGGAAAAAAAAAADEGAGLEDDMDAAAAVAGGAEEDPELRELFEDDDEEERGPAAAAAAGRTAAAAAAAAVEPAAVAAAGEAAAGGAKVKRRRAVISDDEDE
jgi:hypothetical protein